MLLGVWAAKYGTKYIFGVRKFCLKNPLKLVSIFLACKFSWKFIVHVHAFGILFRLSIIDDFKDSSRSRLFNGMA